jgi:hypothetical protein
MDNRAWNISQTGSALIGAGLIKLDDINVGLMLIGAGVVLQILVAVLQKVGVPVSTPPIG